MKLIYLMMQQKQATGIDMSNLALKTKSNRN